MSDSLTRLRERHAAAVSKMKSITDAAELRGGDLLTSAEDAEFRALREERDALAERMTELEGSEARGIPTAGAAAVRNAASGALTPAVTGVREPLVYDKRNAQRSYFRDLAAHTLNRDTDGEARQRLERHAAQVRETSAEFRDLSRTDGQGGYGVPPLWLMNEWVQAARPGRATADLAMQQALPGGTDSINIPKTATGGATAIQTADNAAVQQTDLTDTSIAVPVRTIAGQQAVALQLIEQSPVGFDQILFQDLIADYAKQLDLQVINGSGTSGQMLGILGTSGIGTVTLSDTAQAASTLYSAVANAIQLVHNTRFHAPTAIVMHPRRWMKCLTYTDTQGRPLVVPNAGAAVNALGVSAEIASQGVAGTLLGLPVVVDPNIPTNLGAGTNQDTILVMRASDLLLFEGGIRTRALMEPKASTLEVLIQVYGYLGFTAARYPAGVVQISGAGLSTPSF